MGRLTTHVLNTAEGIPASGLELVLFSISGSQRQELKRAITNVDGRVDGPLLEGDFFREGTYEILFMVGDYFKKASEKEAGFLSDVPIRFVVRDASAHYHVPLLVSPWSYSTYRGS